MSDAPRVMVFPVTLKCNSRCRSCGIWKLPVEAKQDASEQLLDRLISDDFLRANVESINLSGGEPLLHPQLTYLIRHLIESYCCLKEICINTDGHLLAEMGDVLVSALPRCAEQGVKIRMFVSLDGLGERHDKHRRHVDAFTHADRALRFLVDLRRSWAQNLRVTASFTITDRNVDQIVPVLNYVDALGVKVDYMLAARPEVFIGGAGLDRRFQARADQIDQIRLAFEDVRKNSHRSNFSSAYYKTMIDALATGVRTRGCFFPSSGFVLLPDGSVYICGTYRDFLFGNLMEDDFEVLWRGAMRSSCRSEKIPGKCVKCLASSYEEWSDLTGAHV